MKPGVIKYTEHCTNHYSIPDLFHDLQVKALTTEISDLQQEFQNDREEYLETIRNLEQQEKLLQQIIDRIIPTIRKDCNYA